MTPAEAKAVATAMAELWQGEFPATLRVLSAVPDARRDYSPDGKTRTAWQLVTHIPTADAKILPGGSAFISDLGMCGPYDSVLGRRKDRVLKYRTTNMPVPFDVATGDVRMCGLLAEVDPEGIAREPAQFAALVGGGRVLRELARQLGEVGATGDARAQRFQLGDRGGILASDQDMARPQLGDGTGVRSGIAHLDQLQQLEAAGAADRADHLPRLHLRDGLAEGRRDLVDAAPAQVAALERVGTVGRAHGRGLDDRWEN